MVETLSNKEEDIDRETLKIKRKIKWAFICFFSAWVLLILVLILGSLENAGLKGFMQNFGVWLTLLAFLLFAISIILMFMILKYLRKRKKEVRTQIEK